jgi:hypothetical protein
MDDTNPSNPYSRISRHRQAPPTPGQWEHASRQTDKSLAAKTEANSNRTLRLDNILLVVMPPVTAFAAYALYVTVTVTQWSGLSLGEVAVIVWSAWLAFALLYGVITWVKIAYRRLSGRD